MAWPQPRGLGAPYFAGPSAQYDLFGAGGGGGGAGEFTSLHVTGDSALDGNVTVGQALTAFAAHVLAGANLDGDVTVGGGVNVAGSATIGGDCAVTGTVSATEAVVSDTLHVGNLLEVEYPGDRALPVGSVVAAFVTSSPTSNATGGSASILGTMLADGKSYLYNFQATATLTSPGTLLAGQTITLFLSDTADADINTAIATPAVFLAVGGPDTASVTAPISLWFTDTLDANAVLYLNSTNTVANESFVVLSGAILLGFVGTTLGPY